ncbi:hypothetical protein CROQUDRAFT_651987 [Cronartium quercuum f. sp. fusiforme G11]|uniref:Uncharacterized protein n=1 Tax=Cronartium quercuum f. sp. fusiforme G11 TaxID=708437 RepID=A0A9P6NWE7_9BASI|nr:hypothetical protein CROQUDRAFT_651987 [Cronartium quercuum f. sp. fusiforme G11]
MVAARQGTKFRGGLLDTQRELEDLKKVMSQLQSTITSLNRPSHEITCLVFHSPRGQTVKKLYVLSDLLTRYEYFRACHSSDYSEAHNSGGSPSQQSRGVVEKTCIEHNEDSDDEWDIDEEEHEEAHTKFKATIQITDTSRRTYKAFVDYALCGALYFSPPRSSYRSYLLQVVPGKVKLAWPEWAKKYGTTHTSIPGFKTFTSAKSMWRMADMLIIPELKAICQEEIMSSLKVENVVQELQSKLFRTHVEFRFKAYQFVRKNWKDVVCKGGIERMLTNLSPTDAHMITNTILRHLPP